MSYGDVDSDELGTGARFNDGKTRTDLIPLFTIVLAAQNELVDPEDNQRPYRKRSILFNASGVEQGTLSPDYLVKDLSAGDFEAAAAVLEYGSKKYAAWNWAKGQPFSVAMASLKRHVLAIMDGYDTDAESDCSHWGHIVCNLIFLHHMLVHFPDTMDDRPPSKYFGG